MNLKVVILGYTVPDKPEGGYSRIYICLMNLKVVILGYTLPAKPEGGYPRIYCVLMKHEGGYF